MFCRIVILVCSSLLSVAAVAQTIDGQVAPPSLDKLAPQLQKQPNLHAGGVPQGRISVARLRVPRKAQELYNKAIAAMLRHQPLKAQETLARALDIEPQFPEALALRGFIQATGRQWSSAEQSLEAALQTDPGYTPAYVVLAGVYNTQSQYDAAQQTAQRAVTLGLVTWTVQYEMARAFIGKEQYGEALAVTEVALRSDHGPLIHLAKAHALLGLRLYAPAVEQLQIFLRDQPSGDGSQEARDLLDQVAALTPPNSDGE